MSAAGYGEPEAILLAGKAHPATGTSAVPISPVATETQAAILAAYGASPSRVCEKLYWEVGRIH